MKVFISYAGEDRDTAEQIHLALLGDGHTTFFDREALPPGQDYHTQIRLAVEASDALVFLVSPESVVAGSYALTELNFARRRWPHPKGAVLPVFVRPVDWSDVPNYLKSVTVLTPSGNVAAEVLAEIARLARARATDAPQTMPVAAEGRPPQRWRSRWLAGSAAAVLLTIAGLLIFRPAMLFDSDEAPPALDGEVAAPREGATSAGSGTPRRIEVRAGERVTVSAEVGDMAIPYSVSLDGKVVINSLVNREETIADLPLGDHTLAWAFTHAVRGGRHRLAVKAGERALVVLDEKSESTGGSDNSVGAAVLAVIDPSAIMRFEIVRGERITLKTTVGPMAIPYTVSLAGTVRIRSLTSREEIISELPPGEHMLSWAFAHQVKGWHHRLSLGIGARAPVTLDEKSEAARDSDNSLGSVIIAVK